MENIIVDTVDTAKKCLEYLKRYDIGRGTFLALEKTQRWRDKLAKIKTPENAPRLIDLIEVEVRNKNLISNYCFLIAIIAFLLQLLHFYCHYCFFIVILG